MLAGYAYEITEDEVRLIDIYFVCLSLNIFYSFFLDCRYHGACVCESYSRVNFLYHIQPDVPARDKPTLKITIAFLTRRGCRPLSGRVILLSNHNRPEEATTAVGMRRIIWPLGGCPVKIC